MGALLGRGCVTLGELALFSELWSFHLKEGIPFSRRACWRLNVKGLGLCLAHSRPPGPSIHSEGETDPNHCDSGVLRSS